MNLCISSWNFAALRFPIFICAVCVVAHWRGEEEDERTFPSSSSSIFGKIPFSLHPGRRQLHELHILDRRRWNKILSECLWGSRTRNVYREECFYFEPSIEMQTQTHQTVVWSGFWCGDNNRILSFKSIFYYCQRLPSCCNVFKNLLTSY